MSTKFWPVLHSLKKSTSLPRREQWRWPLEVTSIRPTCNWRKAATKERVSYKTTANQLRRNRKKKSEVSRATSFHSDFPPISYCTEWRHLGRPFQTKGSQCCIWQPLENDHDSNGWIFKGQGTVGNWTRCCVLISDFKLVIFFPGWPCPFCIVFTR